MSTRQRPNGPTAVLARQTTATTPSALALEKVIQDHIPSVSLHMKRLLSLLAPSTPLSARSRHSLLLFGRDLRRLCFLAQDGVRHMDLELRTVEADWDAVDKQRWEVCRRDYKRLMKLGQQVWEVGEGRMEELQEVSFREGRTKRAAAAATP